MSISRRLVLKNGAISLASIGMAGFGPSFLRSTVLADTTAGKRKKTLICIFQRGAADGLNIVVPHGDPYLYTHRPGFALKSFAQFRAVREMRGQNFYRDNTIEARVAGFIHFAHSARTNRGENFVWP